MDITLKMVALPDNPDSVKHALGCLVRVSCYSTAKKKLCNNSFMHQSHEQVCKLRRIVLGYLLLAITRPVSAVLAIKIAGIGVKSLKHRAGLAALSLSLDNPRKVLKPISESWRLTNLSSAHIIFSSST